MNDRAFWVVLLPRAMAVLALLTVCIIALMAAHKAIR